MVADVRDPAIALLVNERLVGAPALQIVDAKAHVDETTRQIFWYTVVMVVGTIALPVVTDLWPIWTKAPVYTALSVVLGVVFLGWTWALWKRRPVMPTMPLFRFSIIYIGALFLGLIVDSARLP